jgi:predicted DNA-binding antitoxin AbrB/MazE fold protein
MAITVEAVYENGVLRPAQPLPLNEHEKVTITVQPVRPPPLWERILALTADAPLEELAKPPIDGASQHDHYLYGTPKRPE